MLTITPEAVAYVEERKESLYLDLPPVVRSCCITLQECPAVRLGRPRSSQNYHMRTVEGITLFVPQDLPDIPLTITLDRFLGFKRLVIEGWRLA